MNLILRTVEKYGFNNKQLTEADFHRICETEGIRVVEMDVHTSFYLAAAGLRMIVIRRQLRGAAKLYAQFHELAHALLGHGRHGTAAFYHGLVSSHEEFEADALATIALVPRGALASNDFLDEMPTRFGKRLFRERQRLAFLYGV